MTFEITANQAYTHYEKNDSMQSASLGDSIRSIAECQFRDTYIHFVRTVDVISVQSLRIVHLVFAWMHSLTGVVAELSPVSPPSWQPWHTHGCVGS
jgi:hypothetical protein